MFGVLSLPDGGQTFAVHLVAALLVDACAYREERWLAPVLKYAVLAFMGTVSYGMYLLQMQVKNAVAQIASTLGPMDFSAHPTLLFVLSLASSVLAATVGFR